jgi:G3E family GTPase
MFQRLEMTIHVLSGFLGSGKTTAIRQACDILNSRGSRVAVITNDQGSQLVDGFVFTQRKIPHYQIGGGCFCCNYSQLDNSIESLTQEYQPENLFAEAAGTCTDIVASVIKPLKQFRELRHITFTTVVDARLLQMMLQDVAPFHHDVTYLYFKQLQEAQIILITKIDLINPRELAICREFLKRNYPGAQVVEQNNMGDRAHAPWLELLLSEGERQSAVIPDLDYDRYANGEAMLGYLDQHLVVDSGTNNAHEAALYLVDAFLSRLKKLHAALGHVKFWINGEKISVTATNDDTTGSIETQPAVSCEIIVNARVQVDDTVLKMTMEEAIVDTAEKFEVRIGVLASAHFKPGYPKPEHRFE